MHFQLKRKGEVFHFEIKGNTLWRVKKGSKTKSYHYIRESQLECNDLQTGQKLANRYLNRRYELQLRYS